MQVKTSELIDHALDWAVAKCEKPQWSDDDALMWVQDEDYEYRYSPSTYWQEGGPIIEREKIATWTPMTIFAHLGGPWVAGIPAVDEYGDEIEIDQEYYGPTPLVAAMRCYVGSKLGDEVEIPDELMQ